MRKILTVFGTRPDAIKMCPLILELKKIPSINTIVCVSGQHKWMLDQVLDVFKIEPDYNLEIMKDKQTLSDISSRVMVRFEEVIKNEKPDFVLVHGDTSTALSAAMACFYNCIPIGHVEAGLRTYNIITPFPEEFNRRTISLISSLDFATSINAKDNLVNEGKSENNIYVTGSTINAALSRTIRSDYSSDIITWAKGYKLVLLTAHRRENIGNPFESILRAIKRVVNEVHDFKIIFPVHLNPQIKETAYNELNGVDRIKIVPPLNIIDFHNILARSDLILTDSGGVQEEAAIIGIPTLILREASERSINNLFVTQSIIGTDEETVYCKFKEAVINAKKEERIIKGIIDNGACSKIATIINGYLKDKSMR